MLLRRGIIWIIVTISGDHFGRKSVNAVVEYDEDDNQDCGRASLDNGAAFIAKLKAIC